MHLKTTALTTMRAVLLAAGFGTRLRPLTEHTPKCLVTIGGVPLLQVWLAGLTNAGTSKFLINTHYLSDVVRAWLERHELQDRIEVTYEEKLLGTAGTLRANLLFCGDDSVIVAHADNLCLCDWRSFFAAHHERPEGTVMTMMTFTTPTPESCGIVKVDSRGIVTQFVEKSPTPPGNLANAAIYLFDARFLRQMLTDDPGIEDISTQVIPRLLGRIHAWHNTDTVVDIGTPESLRSARETKDGRVKELLAVWAGAERRTDGNP